MHDIKPWYASKTVWGSLVALIAASAPAFGLQIDSQSQIDLTNALSQIVAVFGSMFAIFGRLTAASIIR